MSQDSEGDVCWICLEGLEDCGHSSSPTPSRLIKPCACPRVVHSICIAKWQLSNAGKSEEKTCRFCKQQLPDWQANLALPGMAAVEPVMSVHFNGATHMVRVRPGEEGRLAFIRDVRRLLRLRDNQEFSITFECKVPGHGMFLDLKGLSSYDAAVFCAAMTAVERQRLAARRAAKSRATEGATAAPPAPAMAAADAAPQNDEEAAADQPPSRVVGGVEAAGAFGADAGGSSDGGRAGGSCTGSSPVAGETGDAAWQHSTGALLDSTLSGSSVMSEATGSGSGGGSPADARNAVPLQHGEVATARPEASSGAWYGMGSDGGAGSDLAGQSPGPSSHASDPRAPSLPAQPPAAATVAAERRLAASGPRDATQNSADAGPTTATYEVVGATHGSGTHTAGGALPNTAAVLRALVRRKEGRCSRRSQSQEHQGQVRSSEEQHEQPQQVVGERPVGQQERLRTVPDADGGDSVPSVVEVARTRSGSWFRKWTRSLLCAGAPATRR